MTYLPELRESLVGAATRQAGPAPVPVRRRPRHRLGAALLALGSLAALAVAAAVLVLAGHRGAPSVAVADVGPRAVAEQLLGHLPLPPGAVPVTRDPGALARFGSAAERPPAGGVAVTRFWRVRGGATAVFTFLQRHETGQAGASFVGESSGPGRTVTESFGVTFAPPQDGPVDGWIDVDGGTLPGGFTELRATAIAVWSPPRSVERIGPGTKRLLVVTSARGRRGSLVIGSASAIADVVAFVNALPIARVPARICASPEVTIRVTFLAPAARPAVATFDPSCSVVELSLPGRRTVALSLNGPGARYRMLPLYTTLLGLDRPDRFGLVSEASGAAPRRVRAVSPSRGSAAHRSEVRRPGSTGGRR